MPVRAAKPHDSPVLEFGRLNYRHAYHAGNFADVFKHAILVELLGRLRAKDAPFCVIDTHAGRGRYDLSSVEAGRTGEHLGGIARLRPRPILAPYLDTLPAFDPGYAPAFYPGSPRIARGLLRPQDRLVAIELHPEDAAALRREFAHDPQVSIHEQDGYQTLKALVPPKERRGLVLLDPPFEATDEFTRLAEALIAAHRRWPTGLYAAWYPIKQRPAVWGFYERMVASGLRRLLVAELLIRPEEDWNRLNGCGMLFLNPPWRLEEWLGELLPTLTADLGEKGAEGGKTVWLAGE